MFTGLIQAQGKIRHLSDTQLRIQCDAASILDDIALGDSIAVDGVCLTVEQSLPQGFIASVSPETLRRSTLGQLKDGQSVNLETSLRAGSKIGGHFVTGHVDGQGVLSATAATAQAWELEFSVPSSQVARYIVPKGSIAVNGISLTIASCEASGARFTVAVIPVTYAETTLSQLEPGMAVNLEGDILGKYVERFATLGASTEQTANSKPVSLEFLLNHGYGQ